MVRDIEREKVMKRKWEKEHPEKVREMSRRRYLKYKDKILAQTNKYKKLNPWITKTAAQYIQAITRGDQLGIVHNFTLNDWRQKLTLANRICLRCSKGFDSLSIDHIEPLGSGKMTYSIDDVLFPILISFPIISELPLLFDSHQI